VKKYLFLSGAFFFSVFFLLQTPFALQQTALANTVNVQCHCVHPGTTGMGSNNGKNNWVCTDPLGNGSCSHQEEYCQNTPGAVIGTTTTGGGRGGPSNTINFVGVSCQTTSVCDCNGNNISCYTPVNGKKTEQQTFQCGTGTSCIKKPGVNDSGFSYLNRPVTGVACVSQCKCDHVGKTGNGNNGWTCKDGSTGSCNNREDSCENTPSGTLSVSCVNSSKCTCNSDKSAIDCISKGSGDNGSDEKQSFSCGAPGLCVTGAGIDDPGFSFANQHISGIKCNPNIPPTLPPPPSPPCKTWANGVCTTFGSTFGGFSTDPNGFIEKIFAVLLSVSGGIALLLIIKAGYQMMTAQGNPEKLNNAREQLVAAIVGLVFLIFSFVFLQLIGFDILHIPGFTP
jgi:type IV secretion system pilin